MTQALDPDTHFRTVIGGYEAARAKYGMTTAHLLWDFARLFARDRGRPPRELIVRSPAGKRHAVVQSLADRWREEYYNVVCRLI